MVDESAASTRTSLESGITSTKQLARAAVERQIIIVLFHGFCEGAYKKVRL